MTASKGRSSSVSSSCAKSKEKQAVHKKNTKKEGGNKKLI